jgi:hypothetical protein
MVVDNLVKVSFLIQVNAYSLITAYSKIIVHEAGGTKMNPELKNC